jgi:hypothetical protein
MKPRGRIAVQPSEQARRNIGGAPMGLDLLNPIMKATGLKATATRKLAFVETKSVSLPTARAAKETPTAPSVRLFEA